MRLVSAKLPKENNKVGRTVKHKDSAKKAARLAKKAIKKATMSVEDDRENDGASMLSLEDKEAAKKERKLINKPRIYYKQINQNITGRLGPRAVGK